MIFLNKSEVCFISFKLFLKPLILLKRLSNNSDIANLHIFEYSNKPKYSYFNDYDDHMMDFNKDLTKSIELFVKSLN